MDTYRIDYLGEAPLRSPTKIFFGGAPRPGSAMIHNFADRSLLVPTPRMDTLSDGHLGEAPPQGPLLKFFPSQEDFPALGA
jgi:hypothetical protein